VRILIVTPALPAGGTGNGVTAARWARILRALHHRVEVSLKYGGQPCDMLVALHARKSFDSIQRFRRDRPRAPVLVALTGTDLYRDLPGSARARSALRLASRLIVLQPLAMRALPRAMRQKARVIIQSARAPRRRPRPRAGVFQACVLAHLRPVKDPLLAARASRLLPPSSRIRIVHLGAALDARMRRLAEAQAAANPRYVWGGSRPHGRALQVLSRSRLLVVTSRLEGGANVASEALACGVPVVSTRIAGSVGVLGPGYPGLFPVGDAAALAQLLWRAETDRPFYRRLEAWCRRLRPAVAPPREMAAWRRLLDEVTSSDRPLS
jgi:putative glycosyltransferase (TIGR04348 family)